MYIPLLFFSFQSLFFIIIIIVISVVTTSIPPPTGRRGDHRAAQALHPGHQGQDPQTGAEGGNTL